MLQPMLLQPPAKDGTESQPLALRQQHGMQIPGHPGHGEDDDGTALYEGVARVGADMINSVLSPFLR